MRQVIKDIHRYTDFNASRYVEVEKVILDGITVAGITHYEDAYNCSLFLEEPTITLVLEGQKYMLVNKKEYFLKRGDLLYIPANTLVFTDISGTRKGFESFNLVLSKVLLHKLYGYQHEKNFGFSDAAFISSQSPDLLEVLGKVRSSQFSEETKNEKLLLELLNPLKKKLFRWRNVPEEKPAEGEIINKVLLQSLYHPLNLSQMASLSNMSLATFKRRFKAVYGVSPKTWMRDQRLQAAYFHLKTNKEKISDIITQIGFENFSHFSYLFRKVFHTRPSRLNQN